MGLDTKELERAVGLLDGIMTSDDFQEKLNEFAKKHVAVFNYDDENKLEYTDIYKSYQVMVEEHIEGKLESSGVNLETFFRDLPEYCELPESHERTGAVLEVLRSLDNFLAFKELMLSIKKTMEGGTTAAPANEVDSMSVTCIDASLEQTRILESAGEGGWIKTADKGWIQTFRKPDPAGTPIDMTRCSAKVNVPAAAFVDIFMNPHVKQEWDKEVSSCDVVGGEGFDKDGFITKTSVKIPFMKEREMLLRQQIKQDFPDKGCWTAVSFGVDDPNHPPSEKVLRCEFKLGNVIARPIDEKSCHITMFGHLNMHFPAFVWNHLSSGWLVRNVVKIESYYKKGYKGPYKV